MLCTNLVVKQLYTDVQLLNSLFQKAYGKVLQYMSLLKILNVSERTRMSVYNCSTGYFEKRWRQADVLRLPVELTMRIALLTS